MDRLRMTVVKRDELTNRVEYAYRIVKLFFMQELYKETWTNKEMWTESYAPTMSNRVYNYWKRGGK